MTLSGQPEDGGTYEICPVCFWEDDGVQSKDPDFRGGANKGSLNEAREIFLQIGAVEERLKQFTRPPTVEERAGGPEFA